MCEKTTCLSNAEETGSVDFIFHSMEKKIPR